MIPFFCEVNGYFLSLHHEIICNVNNPYGRFFVQLYEQ